MLSKHVLYMALLSALTFYFLSYVDEKYPSLRLTYNVDINKSLLTFLSVLFAGVLLHKN